MYVSCLNLVSFRNYESLRFDPSESLNVLLGRNAQGKSAILEALYLLATSKSHRTSRDMDMIRLADSSARVCAELNRSARNDIAVEIVLSRLDNKVVKINNVKHPKIGDLVGQLNAVIFSDSDIGMVRGEPSRRRRFLNLEISQIRPQYVYALGRYKRVLDQRNNLLREIKAGMASIDGLNVWDQQLVTYGATVIARRAEFVEFLSRTAAEVYLTLTDGSEELGIAYKSNVDIADHTEEADIEARFREALASTHALDLARSTTNVGPHRDDLAITIQHVPAREFGSQGQQRTAAIALKLAEIDLMEQAVGEAPIVLLDDIMAELDEARRKRVFDSTIGRCQTIVTTAHLSDLAPAMLEKAAIFEVESGAVTRQ